MAAHAHEVAAHGWSTPAEALDRFAAGEIDLWPPTATTLAQLDGVRELDDVRRWLSPVEPSAAPVVEAVAPGLTRVRVSGGGGIPGVRVDAWILGRERVLVVDPGGTTDRELDAILGTVSRHGASIGAVAVTSDAPDHVGGAVALALVAGAPLLAPPAAARRIGEPAMVVGDGESIAGIDVRVVARHVAGACVYEAAELGVVLTGDLGTVGPSRGVPASWTGSAADAVGAALAGRRLGAHEPAVGQAGGL